MRGCRYDRAQTPKGSEVRSVRRPRSTCAAGRSTSHGSNVSRLRSHERHTRLDAPVLLPLLALALALMPALTTFYDARYATPVYGSLSAAAVFGARGVWTEVGRRQWRRQRAAADA